MAGISWIRWSASHIDRNDIYIYILKMPPSRGRSELWGGELWRLLWLFGLSPLVLNWALVAANPDAKRLYDDLLSNYNKLVRPVVNTSDVLKVCIKLKLSQLIDVVSIQLVQISMRELMLRRITFARSFRLSGAVVAVVNILNSYE